MFLKTLRTSPLDHFENILSLADESRPLHSFHSNYIEKICSITWFFSARPNRGQALPPSHVWNMSLFGVTLISALTLRGRHTAIRWKDKNQSLQAIQMVSVVAMEKLLTCWHTHTPTLMEKRKRSCNEQSRESIAPSVHILTLDWVRPLTMEVKRSKLWPQDSPECLCMFVNVCVFMWDNELTWKGNSRNHLKYFDW